MKSLFTSKTFWLGAAFAVGTEIVAYGIARLVVPRITGQKQLPSATETPASAEESA